MMQFYTSPGSCAVGTRILLEETGAEYQAHRFNLGAKEHLNDDYKKLNPKAKVPALVRPDGSVLTETQAIAFWLADAFPEAALLPEGAEGRLRVMELLDYMVGSVHMRGFTFVIVPHKFGPTPEFQEQIKAHGKAQIAIGFGNISEVLGDKDYLFGAFSVADAVLFYMTRWAVMVGLDMPANIAAHHNRMLDRPATQRALKGEGIEVGRA
ncbi:glutathione S-transferase family protein [Tropicibacter naphthalenivorans]|uniref:Glutathione S-transferase GstA n=1 Tax=Tropicibacter naphthalenivorans TaxID=441103 RepID=A0A0P1GH40_9RHOB|nr:glutathione S-transferase N-terminal domain-containing protein [Tropicibacter naphthalenivorans]CUH81254.1 Glutathione S-transferase GstA [Tropicibacter naphthalenivorans]SMC98000.1 glutathione S-transferase [Tropicibacter naphthalenivorans]